MASPFSRIMQMAFAPPHLLSMPAIGIDLSTSGAKGVLIKEQSFGLTLATFADVRFATAAFTEGDVTDAPTIVGALKELSGKLGERIVNVSLPESKSYLFEAKVPGDKKEELRLAIEQHIDEYVPLPPAEVMFDIVPLSKSGGETQVLGVGYAKRIVEGVLNVCEDAGLIVRALESESFAAARSLLPFGEIGTVLVVDIGKTTTKLTIVAGGVPRFATTVGIGGHSLTLSVQKHFGVTETEARRVKLAHGIVPGEGNEDYLAAMLSTASAIRDEIAHRLEYWQAHAVISGGHEPVSRAVLVGGNASVRGLPEYLEGSLHIPVTTGNVFTNFASTDHWLPPLDYTQSLVYSTAVGLALRDYAP
jgi:type IV pilus assembly protein PilM